MTAALVRLWAIASMTLLEASRRKVFSILLLFAAALLSSILFFPAVEVDARLRLVEVWSLRASGLFTAIVGLFLAGFALPQDFEQKRIYMIVTKPVSKPLVFLGRYAGYALLLAVFVGAMGVITTGFLRAVKMFSSEKFPPLVAYPRLAADSLTGGTPLDSSQATMAQGFGPDKVLAWSWSGLRRGNFEDQARLRARFIFGALNDPYRAAGTIDFRISNRQKTRTHSVRLAMNTNEERIFEFPSSLIDGDGNLRVEARVVDADGVIATSPDWLVLYEKSMSFELAFARGLGLILLQSLIVLSVTLAGSTFLSAPLSIILGILLYIVGSIHTYVREGSREIDQSLTEIRTSKTPVRTPENLPVWVLSFSTTMSKAALAAVPDFANFDYSVWLLKDQAVSWSELAGAAGKAVVPIAVLIALGLLVMYFKDFDR
jgi:hypothetical protein